MVRYQKIICLLLGGIILVIFLNRLADIGRKSYQLKKPESRQDFVRRQGFANRQNYVNIPWPYTSNLPIVIIDTGGSWIPNEPKVPAHIKVIYDESGGRNSLDTPHIHFEGKIGIEVRGQTSQMFPKKQYGFEFQDESGNDKDVSIFGLPAESDWVLNGPYSDKTLMRNYLSFEFSNRIGRYASRTKFVEVFLNTNGDKTIKAQHYVGVYLLIEKIKRGKERIAIQSLKSTHNKPPEITGGYILKIDKMDSQETFFYTRRNTHLAHVYPKGREMSHAQKVWIQNYMNNFETALAGPKFKDSQHGYAKYIDADSFIDHFIINELFKNTDGFRYSTYHRCQFSEIDRFFVRKML